MKKTYMSPETSLLLVRTQNMFATSNPTGFDGKLDDTEEPTSPDNMLSRRRSTWDDMEEEEEEW